MAKNNNKALINKGLTKDNLFTKPNLKNWRMMLPILILLAVLIGLGLKFQLSEKVIGGSALAIGIASGALAWIIGVIGLVPIVGPLIVKVLAIPIVWLINGLGYVVSFVAIKRGYSQDVLTYRGLTIALIVGIVIGFVIGSLV